MLHLGRHRDRRARCRRSTRSSRSEPAWSRTRTRRSTSSSSPSTRRATPEALAVTGLSIEEPDQAGRAARTGDAACSRTGSRPRCPQDTGRSSSASTRRSTGCSSPTTSSATWGATRSATRRWTSRPSRWARATRPGRRPAWTSSPAATSGAGRSPTTRWPTPSGPGRAVPAPAGRTGPAHPGAHRHGHAGRVTAQRCHSGAPPPRARLRA